MHHQNAFHPANYVGAAEQLTTPNDNLPLLDAAGSHIQEMVSVFLYYGRAVDSTMLVTLCSIASIKNMEETADVVTHLLNYAASNPDATICFRASDICLKKHSDASYLSEPKARSRAGGYYFLRSNSPLPTSTSFPPPENGAIHTLSSIMKVVLSSSTEAELGACLFNAKDGIMIRIILYKMGHAQPTTPSKLTTAVLPELPMTQSNNDVPKPSTCAFTGKKMPMSGPIPHPLEKRS
eukprot:scaffold198557_cov48-Attheya_sp.AAC.1